MSWAELGSDDEDNLQEHERSVIEIIHEIWPAIEAGDEKFEDCMAQAWDDVRGGFIDAMLVKEAREEDEQGRLRVCDNASTGLARPLSVPGGRTVSDSPNIRCRLRCGKADDAFYASGPPLEAKKALFGMTFMRLGGWRGVEAKDFGKFMFTDVGASRGYVRQ